MKKTILTSLCVAACAVAGYHALTKPDPSPGAAPQLAGSPPDATALLRGAYLARAADCIACHTAPGGKAFAGGLAFKLPFGTLYSSNITPDRQTGIGAWSDDDFVRALHDGVNHDGKRLYPAFPYTSYTLLSRADVLDIKAYLLSLPAVNQATPAPDLMFPFNQRWAMGFWNAAFFTSRRYAPAPAQPPIWQQGAYLATALAHCAECHTPRNIGFALDHDQEFAGATVNGWRAPNITSDPVKGIGRWTDAQLYSYLRSGHADGHGSAAGPMAEAIENSLQYLAPQDMQALVTYVRSIGPAGAAHMAAVAAPAPAPAPAPTVSFAPSPSTPGALDPGMKLFEGSCASCHRFSGEGSQSHYAALIGAHAVNDPSGRNVIQVILHGQKAQIANERLRMPAFAGALDDNDIASLANYVIFQFGGKRGAVTSKMVALQRKE